MSKDYEVRKVKIGSYIGVGSGGYATFDSNGKSCAVINIEVDDKSLEERICVIDKERENAIDIFSSEVFHIIKRDKNNRILDPIDKLHPGITYVLQVMEKKELDDSKIFRLYCAYLARNVVSEYEKRHGDGEIKDSKIKKKTKKG